MLGLHVVLDDGRPRPRWLPDLSKTGARCGISRPRQYFQRNHSVFLNYSAFRGISSFTPTGYGAIAGTIGSRSNPPETGLSGATMLPALRYLTPAWCSVVFWMSAGRHV